MQRILQGLAFTIVFVSSLAMVANASGLPIQTGSDLYNACAASSSETADASTRAAQQRCRNYLAGFVQASVITRTPTGMESPYAPRSGEALCYWLPDEMTWSEVEVLVIDHGQENPEALDMYAADFLVEVFVASFPCEDASAD